MAAGPKTGNEAEGPGPRACLFVRAIGAEVDGRNVDPKRGRGAAGRGLFATGALLALAFDAGAFLAAVLLAGPLGLLDLGLQSADHRRLRRRGNRDKTGRDGETGEETA